MLKKVTFLLLMLCGFTIQPFSIDLNIDGKGSCGLLVTAAALTGAAYLYNSAESSQDLNMQARVVIDKYCYSVQSAYTFSLDSYQHTFGLYIVQNKKEIEQMYNKLWYRSFVDSCVNVSLEKVRNIKSYVDVLCSLDQYYADYVRARGYIELLTRKGLDSRDVLFCAGLGCSGIKYPLMQTLQTVRNHIYEINAFKSWLSNHILSVYCIDFSLLEDLKYNLESIEELIESSLEYQQEKMLKRAEERAREAERRAHNALLRAREAERRAREAECCARRAEKVVVDVEIEVDIVNNTSGRYWENHNDCYDVEEKYW